MGEWLWCCPAAATDVSSPQDEAPFTPPGELKGLNSPGPAPTARQGVKDEFSSCARAGLCRISGGRDGWSCNGSLTGISALAHSALRGPEWGLCEATAALRLPQELPEFTFPFPAALQAPCAVHSHSSNCSCSVQFHPGGTFIRNMKLSEGNSPPVLSPAVLEAMGMSLCAVSPQQVLSFTQISQPAPPEPRKHQD